MSSAHGLSVHTVEVSVKLAKACTIFAYFIRDCQKADWKNHKASCTDFKGPKASNGSA